MAVMELGMVSEVISSPFKYRCCATCKGFELLKLIPHHAAKSEICTAVREEQELKALLPIYVTELGIEIEVKLEHLLKA